MPIITPMATNSKLPCSMPIVVIVTLDKKAPTYNHHVMDMQSSAWTLKFG